MQSLRGHIVGCIARSYTSSVKPLQRSTAALIQTTNFKGAKHVPFESCVSPVHTRSFTCSRRYSKKQEAPQPQVANSTNDGQKPEKRSSARSAVGKTSLRRVAVEAERSRHVFIRGRGRRRFVDPDVETKIRYPVCARTFTNEFQLQTITAYCAAEQYNIATAAHLLKADGYELDPFQAALYPQVIHVVEQSPAMQEKTQERGDIFVFPSGTVVTWNVPERKALKLVETTLLPAAENPHPTETENLEYLEDTTREQSSIVGDTVILGTKIEARASESLDESLDESPKQPGDDTLPNNDTPLHHPAVDTVLAKIAFSSGLARSTKLAVLESLLNAYFDSTRSIPTMLSRGAYANFSRAFILRKTGELLSVRAQLNLYSELTDSLPDLFWDSRHELGLEGYYDEVGRALDVGIRIKVLNEKMDYAQEIATVLRERLSERHSLGLEWGIIFLIAVEVGFELLRQWKDYHERNDPNSTEAMLRRYLAAAEESRGRKG